MREPPSTRKVACFASVATIFVVAVLWQGRLALRVAAPGACAAPCPPGLEGGAATLASALSAEELAAARQCSEALYRCGDATLVFVHTHKGGGTSLVAMARANRAGLAAREKNGDPIIAAAAAAGKRRAEWWLLPADEQARWFERMRASQGTRFVATEKGFLRFDSNLLAPRRLVYAIVLRHPVKRLVSYYFWKHRDKSLAYTAARRAGVLSVARLAEGAPPFGDFLRNEQPVDGYYVRRLLGMVVAADPRDAGADAAALGAAKRVLSEVFSLILITERLADLGEPAVRRVLGWTRAEFAAFHAKNNPPPDLALLEDWRADWNQHLAASLPLDIDVYEHALRTAEARGRLLGGGGAAPR